MPLGDIQGCQSAAVNHHIVHVYHRRCLLVHCTPQASAVGEKFLWTLDKAVLFESLVTEPVKNASKLSHFISHFIFYFLEKDKFPYCAYCMRQTHDDSK